MKRIFYGTGCFFFSVVCAGSDIAIYEIPAFFNLQKPFIQDHNVTARLELNPVPIPLNEYMSLKTIGAESQIQLKALKGETIYKGLIIENIAMPEDLVAELAFPQQHAIFNEENTELSLVSTWFQAGKHTTFAKNKQYLTHELLLKSDVGVTFDDEWLLNKSKWSYKAPAVLGSESITTRIPKNNHRRLLVEINVPESIAAGSYHLFVDVATKQPRKLVRRLKIDVDVADVGLVKQLKEKYNLFIYTMLSIDPKVGRANTYINGQNNAGSMSYQKRMYQEGMNDISDKGFNGVLVTDWRPKYVAMALSAIDSAGIKDVIIYGKSPIAKGRKIVHQRLIDEIKENKFTPIFYGYDEPGGNKKLQEQLLFNQEVHSAGSQSMNAVFWEDLPKVLDSIESDKEHFDYLTVSMGSHGNGDFLNELPLSNRQDKVRYLAYWHPHVENPVRNKLFMGYWLWASGLDGVSPHAYLIKPHVAQVKGQHYDEVRGRLSPYNDFSMWDNAESPFRQHATVYPKKEGFISTLQWEAVADGVTDLILVNQLEGLVAARGETPQRQRALALLEAIKARALIRNTSAITEKDTKEYQRLMTEWKADIKQLIIEYGA